MSLGNIIIWAAAFLALIISVIILVKRIWLPYSKFLVFFLTYFLLFNFLLLFNMPNWIKNIGFGIAFLIFPILDGMTTKIVLTKYGGREANPIMAWVIKKISIRFSMFIPFTFFLIFVLFFWEKTDSSALFALTIGYFAVIVNNVIVIQGKKRKLTMAKKNEIKIN